MPRPRKLEEDRREMIIDPTLVVLKELIDSLLDHYIGEFGDRKVPIILKLKALKESIGD